MSRWTVAPTQEYLLKDGRPFFYLADTAWMAFANLPLADWPRYLAYRKLQGFTALQISILPVTHDTSMSPQNVDPFLPDAQGNWDFTRYNEAYFAKAEQMVEMAVAAGFAPVLGVLWCSYVPGTRCSDGSPVASAMPLAAVAPYATYAAQRFARFDPIYFVSGDTQFESPEEEPYYMAALQAVKAVSPDALLTMHLTPSGELSPRLCRRHRLLHVPVRARRRAPGPALPAGGEVHGLRGQAPGGQRRAALRRPRPRGRKTRFNAFDVRKAVWQSLLSGAKMGVTYGAHGVWMFHQPGMRFSTSARSFEPYAWDVALTMARGLGRGLCPLDVRDPQLLCPRTGRPRVERRPRDPCGRQFRPRTVAIYVPYAFDIMLDLDLAAYTVVLIDLATRRVAVPDVVTGTPLAHPHAPVQCRCARDCAQGAGGWCGWLNPLRGDNRPTLGPRRKGWAALTAPSEGRMAAVVRPTTGATCVARPLPSPNPQPGGASLARFPHTQPTTRWGEPRTVSPFHHSHFPSAPTP